MKENIYCLLGLVVQHEVPRDALPHHPSQGGPQPGRQLMQHLWKIIQECHQNHINRGFFFAFNHNLLLICKKKGNFFYKKKSFYREF